MKTHRTLPNERLLLAVVSAALAVIAVVGVSLRAAPASAAFHRHPLMGESNAAIGSYALSATLASVKVLSGTPQVVLVRTIHAADMPSLGLGSPPHWAGGEPPLTLVIIHGDFNIIGIGPGAVPGAVPPEAAYIGYIFDFDDRIGMATMILTSRRGELFRIALNDPNLPSDAPNGAAPTAGSTAVAVPTPRLSHTVLPYGSVAPTAGPTP
jgi:hypothetical protein